MTVATRTLGQQVTERIVRVAIAVVGLLILRGVLSLMPMLRSNPVYTASWHGVSFYDLKNPRSPQDIWQALSDAQVQALLEEIQREENRLRAIGQQTDPGYALRVQNEILLGTYLAIFPITIVKAAVDTLIFAVLLLFARSLVSLFRTHYTKMPDLGLMISLCLVTCVVAIAYHSYQALAYPFLFPDNYAIYGWVFLILVLAPLVGLGLVVARNMDAITAFVMHSGSALAAAPSVSPLTRCSSCGQPISGGAKFCSDCGAAASAPTSTASARSVCPSCGAENPGSAKFCKECGHPM